VDQPNVTTVSRMNWRRYLLALAVASVATLVTDVLLNAVVFREGHTRAAPFLLPPDQLNARIPTMKRGKESSHGRSIRMRKGKCVLPLRSHSRDRARDRCRLPDSSQ
jgi:hypothetical protein